MDNVKDFLLMLISNLSKNYEKTSIKLIDNKDIILENDTYIIKVTKK